MTTRPTDDSLPHDPRFDAAWRMTSKEEPPPALDAAILAAARREVGAKPQGLASNAAMRARRRWWPLAAAATVAVIAIGVVQRVGHDELVTPASDSSIVSDMPAQNPKSVAEAPQRAPEAPQRAPEAPQRAPEAPQLAPQAARNAQPAARADASRGSETTAAPRSEKKSQSAASIAPSLPEPFPAASPKPGAAAPRDAISAPLAPATTGNVAGAGSAPQVASQAAPSSAPMAERSAERGAAQRQEASTAAKPAAPPMPPAASFADSTRLAAPSTMRSSPLAKTANAGAAEEARIKDRASLTTDDWIALIRRLRDEGNTVEAARELAAFRTAHVDHEKLLPPDLRDWHSPEK